MSNDSDKYPGPATGTGSDFSASAPSPSGSGQASTDAEKPDSSALPAYMRRNEKTPPTPGAAAPANATSSSPRSGEEGSGAFASPSNNNKADRPKIPAEGESTPLIPSWASLADNDVPLEDDSSKDENSCGKAGETGARDAFSDDGPPDPEGGGMPHPGKDDLCDFTPWGELEKARGLRPGEERAEDEGAGQAPPAAAGAAAQVPVLPEYGPSNAGNANLTQTPAEAADNEEAKIPSSQKDDSWSVFSHEPRKESPERTFTDTSGPGVMPRDVSFQASSAAPSGGDEQPKDEVPVTGQSPETPLPGGKVAGGEEPGLKDRSRRRSPRAEKTSAPGGSFSFRATHPILTVPETMPPSLCSRLFNGLALFPILPLTLMLVLQTIFTLDARDLWFSDEIRHADAFRNLLDGHWLVLHMNGMPYPDKPPLYFWFLWGLFKMLGTDGPMLHFTAAAVSGLLFLWASLGLGKMVGRADGRTLLAAGIILLSTGYVMGLLHYARMDLLFSALILAGSVALFRAYVRPENSPGGMILAFVLAGAASLVKGPLAFAFPLCALVPFAVWRGRGDQARGVAISLAAALFGLLPVLLGAPVLRLFGLLPAGASTPPLFWSLAFLALPALFFLAMALLMPRFRLCIGLSALLMAACFVLAGGTPFFRWPLIYVLGVAGTGLLLIWAATPQRLFRKDLYIGLAAGLLVPLLWLAAIYWQTGSPDFIIDSLVKEQVLQRAADTFHHKESWHYYLIRLPLMFLPWTLLILALPWSRALKAETRAALTASRTPAGEGSAFLWCMVLSSVALLSALSGKILIYFLPALPALAFLAARAVLRLNGGRAALLRHSLAFFLLLCAVLLVLASLMLFGALPMPSFKWVPQWRLPSESGFIIMAALFAAAAAMLWLGLKSSRPEGVLLVMALFATIVSYPLAATVAPSFDAVLSPKSQALLMRAYIQRGYSPATYRDYPGTYAFYAGQAVPRLPSLDEAAALADKGPLVLAMRRSELEQWENSPSCLEQVHSQWIETREYVLLACPPIAGLAPAEPEYAPAPDIVGGIMRLLGLEPSSERATPDAAPANTAPDENTDAAPKGDVPAPPDAEKQEAIPGEDQGAPPSRQETPAGEPEHTPEKPNATEENGVERTSEPLPVTVPPADDANAPQDRPDASMSEGAAPGHSRPQEETPSPDPDKERPPASPKPENGAAPEADTPATTTPAPAPDKNPIPEPADPTNTIT